MGVDPVERLRRLEATIRQQQRRDVAPRRRALHFLSQLKNWVVQECHR